MHTFTGGCHCRRVTFRVRVQELVALECNCSICAKKGFLHVIVPKASFELLSGAGDVTTYRFNTGVAQHLFCRWCGIASYYVPRSHPEGISVNLRCLDGYPIDGFVVRPFDGARWESAAADAGFA